MSASLKRQNRPKKLLKQHIYASALLAHVSFKGSWEVSILGLQIIWETGSVMAMQGFPFLFLLLIVNTEILRSSNESLQQISSSLQVDSLFKFFLMNTPQLSSKSIHSQANSLSPRSELFQVLIGTLRVFWCQRQVYPTREPSRIELRFHFSFTFQVPGSPVSLALTHFSNPRWELHLQNKWNPMSARKFCWL